MKFRLITSLLLIAVLAGLYLWRGPPRSGAADGASTQPAVEAPSGPASSDADPLRNIKIHSFH